MKYENFTFVSFPSLTLIFSRILCLWFQLLISVLLLSPNLWFNPFFGIRFSVQVGRYLKKETRNLSVHIVQTITNGSHEPGLMSLLKEEIKTLHARVSIYANACKGFWGLSEVLYHQTHLSSRLKCFRKFTQTSQSYGELSHITLSLCRMFRKFFADFRCFLSDMSITNVPSWN